MPFGIIEMWAIKLAWAATYLGTRFREWGAGFNGGTGGLLRGLRSNPAVNRSGTSMVANLDDLA